MTAMNDAWGEATRASFDERRALVQRHILVCEACAVTTVDELLEAARSRLRRVTAVEAAAAAERNAPRRHPAGRAAPATVRSPAVLVDRNVLEWRLDREASSAFPRRATTTAP